MTGRRKKGVSIKNCIKYLMGTMIKTIIVTLSVALNIADNVPAEGILAVGQQSQIAIDHSGNIRITYGNGIKSMMLLRLIMD